MQLKVKFVGQLSKVSMGKELVLTINCLKSSIAIDALKMHLNLDLDITLSADQTTLENVINGPVNLGVHIADEERIITVEEELAEIKARVDNAESGDS